MGKKDEKNGEKKNYRVTMTITTRDQQIIQASSPEHAVAIMKSSGWNDEDQADETLRHYQRLFNVEEVVPKEASPANGQTPVPVQQDNG